MTEAGWLPTLFAEFSNQYDSGAGDRIWRSHSEKFARFWKEKVLAGPAGEIPEDQIDEIVKILDRNGKGNTKDTEAVAKAMIAQGAWRRMFNEMHTDKTLAEALSNVMSAPSPTERIANIDKLYTMNEGRKNHLTGKSGNAVNCFLVVSDPFSNISMISLNDRLMLIHFFNFPLGFDLSLASTGRLIVETNRIILEGFKSFGIEANARTISRFCYYPPFKLTWKGERKVRVGNKEVAVPLPVEDDEETSEILPESEQRESIEIQALLARIGNLMGMKIWLPRSDRKRVLKLWKPEGDALLDTLPLNYTEAVLGTIEQIDVLWIRKNAVVRAFEVEHTTSVYSGLLRMADLLAMQPNMRIRFHIVAPAERREKVLREIRRPVFALFEEVSLPEICTYLSYDSIRELAKEKHLEHLSDNVLATLEESAETD